MSRWPSMLLWLTWASWSPSFPLASSFLFAPRRQGVASFSFGRQHHDTIADSGHRQCDRVRRRAATTPLSAASPSSATTTSAVADFYANLDRLYDEASAIKCPFFRRRAADLIDGAAQVGQFLLIRHKSLPGLSDLLLDRGATIPSMSSVVLRSATTMSLFSAPGCKPLGRHIKRHPDGTADKTRDLPLADIARRVRGDWTGGGGGETKGYYITGRLDSTIYRDDCLFTGPDPDMPVRGLRKYLSAAAHLFDPRESHAEMLSFTSHEHAGGKGCGTVEVRWRLGGVIQLPWHPKVEPWTGTTRYHLDEEGLIYLHEEGWDISVWRAFICTLFPEATSWKVWGPGERSSWG